MAGRGGGPPRRYGCTRIQIGVQHTDDEACGQPADIVRGFPSIVRNVLL